MSGGSDLERPPPLLLVERQLHETEGYLLDVVASDFPFVSVLAQHLLRAGGKRLRVALTFLGAGFGDRNESHESDIRKLAAALELTHTATLQHDDIIDKADRRHGVPSVNANWTNTLAVLSGDYLFAKSSLLAAEVGGEVPHVLAATIAALCEGQIKEIEAAYQTRREPGDYLEVIERKTARLFASAAYLGARVGGADTDVARRLERYGTTFGLTFQLVDDLLDFLGDERKLGKPVGSDIRAGVYTLPVLHAMGERDDIAELVRTDDAVPKLVETMHETGSFKYARAETLRYANEAVEIARSLADVPERESLESLIDFVVERIPASAAA
jgi:geranylgeranyl pyrophosphate synthase